MHTPRPSMMAVPGQPAVRLLHRPPDATEEEGRRLLPGDPALLDELREFDRQYSTTETELIGHYEVRRHLKLDPEQSL